MLESTVAKRLSWGGSPGVVGRTWSTWGRWSPLGELGEERGRESSDSHQMFPPLVRGVFEALGVIVAFVLVGLSWAASL